MEMRCMAEEKNGIVCTAINIVCLDEPLEWKKTILVGGQVRRGHFLALWKCIVASHSDFMFSLRGESVWLFSSEESETILNSGPGRAHLSYFCSYANSPVIVGATHRHSNSSVHINVALQ